MRRSQCLPVLASCMLIAAACSGGEDRSETAAAEPESSELVDETDQAAVDSIVAVDDEATIDELLSSISEPEQVDPAAERPCDKYEFACSPLEATVQQLDIAIDGMHEVVGAIEVSDDAREQLRLALLTVARMEGVGYLEADFENATMLSFSVAGAPIVSVLTEAGQLRDDGEVVEIDDTFSMGQAEPEGLARPQSLRPVSIPQRYEPAGGPTNSQRRALVVNPFEWDSGDVIAGIFRAEDEYTTVDVLTGDDVNPFRLDSVGSYDAVHIISHGGGSCPPWTDDRDACTSTFVGGPIDVDIIAEEMAGIDVNVGLEFWLCNSGGVDRWCFNNNAFAPNPNGITYFGSCGSDFGFNNTGAGASVGWTGTTQRIVAERTGEEFWRLMVTEGVEFELAEQLIKGGSFDSHRNTWWASGGDVNFFTESVFAGRNLRARDVVVPMVDGAMPRGQVVRFNGTPQNGEPERFPAEGQQITFTLDGVRDGSEAGVRFEIRGNGEVWEIDVELERDGVVLVADNGYSSWLVTLRPDSVKIPDVMWSDLLSTAEPIDLEVRAFENAGEYTADLGSIRLGTEVVASGPLPAFTELESTIASAGGEVTGNDLRVTFKTDGGQASGELHVAMSGQGIEIGTWDIEIEGTYDAEAGTMRGTAVAQSQVEVAGINAGDSGEGEFSGNVDLVANTVTLTIGLSGQSQQYNGVFVS